MAKAKATTRAAMPGFCAVLKGGIASAKNDVSADKKNIRAQEILIRQLTKQKAKPTLIKQAEERLAMLENTLELDEAQLVAFREEFAMSCHV